MQLDEPRAAREERGPQCSEGIVKHILVTRVTVGCVLLFRFMYVHGHDGPGPDGAGERRMISDPEISLVPEELDRRHSTA